MFHLRLSASSQMFDFLTSSQLDTQNIRKPFSDTNETSRRDQYLLSGVNKKRKDDKTEEEACFSF